ncbi:MAG: hypothetical protein QOJ52_1450, partial [Acidimicrobiaceae bacterium]|nr:hypothetical protein [Acidimicrobiaceae bacterium]
MVIDRRGAGGRKRDCRCRRGWRRRRNGTRRGAGAGACAGGADRHQALLGAAQCGRGTQSRLVGRAERRQALPELIGGRGDLIRVAAAHRGIEAGEV